MSHTQHSCKLDARWHTAAVDIYWDGLVTLPVTFYFLNLQFDCNMNLETAVVRNQWFLYKTQGKTGAWNLCLHLNLSPLGILLVAVTNNLFQNVYPSPHQAPKDF